MLLPVLAAGLLAVATTAASPATLTAVTGAGHAPHVPPAGPQPVERLYGAPLRTVPTTGKVVALTFNAAWGTDGLDTVLKVLRQQRAPATFFVTGHFAERHPQGVRAIAAAGHGIGNHSHTHAPFGALTVAERAEEITLAQAAIRRAGNGTPSGAFEPLPFFRFPYGDAPAPHVAEVNALGYADIEWTTDTNGYKGTTGQMTVQKAVARALGALTPGEIIQMHVGSLDGQGEVLDARALPQIIDAVRTRGYRITDLRGLLTEPGRRRP